MAQSPSRRPIAALVITAAVLAGCSAVPEESRKVVVDGDRRGLTLRAAVSATDKSLVVETVVRNNRAKPVYLVSDQCGRITEALLARTKFEPEGKAWTGSLQAVKELILEDQAFDQAPDQFAPRIPGETSANTPSCVHLERPHELAPGEEVAERWEMYLGAFDVGPEDSVVRVEVVEAKGPDEAEYLDILSAGEADAQRAGRNLRVATVASSVADWEPVEMPERPSLGQLYDRLLESPALRRWIEAQPADSWRVATLSPFSPFVATPITEQVRLTMLTTEYERGAVATATAEGTNVAVDLPGESDRTRVFPRRPGTTPPGIEVIAEKEGYVLREDILPGSLELPSGRVVVGEFLFDEKPLDIRVEPGSYPVHATLARYHKHDFDDVALATLVLSDEETVRWERALDFAVDGGSATITSPEGVALMRATFDKNEADWERLHERIFESRAAHEYHVTEFGLDKGVNLVGFSSGGSDGVYPVFVGRDAAGEPTRVVVDFFLLHLAWPRR